MKVWHVIALFAFMLIACMDFDNDIREMQNNSIDSTYYNQVK